jgi:hypothetical protein
LSIRAARIAAVVVTALSFLFVACGGDDSADLEIDLDGDLEDILATPENLLPPCSLVTREQAEAILGFPVDEPRVGKDEDTCIYEETDPNGFGGTVIVSQPAGFNLFDQLGGTPTPVPAVNDSATFYPDVLALVFEQNGHFIGIELRTSSNAPPDLEVATGFANAAREDLP